MTQVCSVFGQLLQLFSRGEFARAVKQHKAEKHAKGFTCWGQFVAMMLCQVANLKSLREVVLVLASCEAPLKQFIADWTKVRTPRGDEKMPRFGKLLSSQEIDHLVAYLRFMKDHK